MADTDRRPDTGERLTECKSCYALIDPDVFEQHLLWHDMLDARLLSMGLRPVSLIDLDRYPTDGRPVLCSDCYGMGTTNAANPEHRCSTCHGAGFDVTTVKPIKE